jgi:hypothetical protein
MTGQTMTALTSVLDCQTFPSADAKYWALVAATPEDEPMSRLSSPAAPDEFSDLECRVFCFDQSEVPALLWAYERYLSLLGCCDEYFGEFAEEERRMYPEFYDGGCWCFQQAVGFMKTTCKLDQPECMAWVLKIVAAEVRNGLYTYPE